MSKIILNDIEYNKNQNSKYYFLRNSAGKEWLIPVSSPKVGMAIYQPVTLKGFFLKHFICGLQSNSIIGQKLFIVKEYSIIDEAESIIAQYFKIEKNMLTYSFFMGTPGVHQKQIVQISYNDIPIGYLKITQKKEIYNLFCAERDILKELHSQNIDFVPAPLVCTPSNDNNFYFYLQTTKKTINSVIKRRFSKEHLNFLTFLFLSTSKKQKYCSTTFYKNVMKPLEDKNCFVKVRCDKKKQEFLLKTYERGIEYLNSVFFNEYVEFSVAHRDFTPWNIIFDKGKIFVFDWEYAQVGYPPMIDMFHFLLQVEFCEKKTNVNVVLRKYKKIKNVLEKYFFNICNYELDLIFISYLLDIESLYLLRTEIIMDAYESELIIKRMVLLSKLL